MAHLSKNHVDSNCFHPTLVDDRTIVTVAILKVNFVSVLLRSE